MLQNNATPQLLLGVSHNDKSGQLVLCVTEDRSDEEVILLLLGALKQMGVTLK